MSKISQYKREILAAIIGALLSAVLSLSVGYYNLKKTFELTQKKELRYSLHKDITLLRKVESELDENINLLLNNDYRIVIETEVVPMPSIPTENKEDEKFIKKLMTYYKFIMGGDLKKITKLNMPRNKFVIDAWEAGGPIVSNIEFGLIQSINDLYRKLLRINKLLEKVDYINTGDTYSSRTIKQLNRIIPELNSLINELSQKKLVELKNEIIKHMDMLRKEYSKIKL